MTTDVHNRIREVALEEKEPQQETDYLRTDWQELSEMGPQYEECADLLDNVVDRDYWINRVNRWSDEVLDSMEGWIESQKTIADYNQIDECPIVVPEQLNYLQRMAFEIVRDHVEKKQQLMMILQGAAGSGKTFTIHAISTYLKGHIMRAAPTAKAAFLINGDTIHQMLSIKVSEGNNYIELTAEPLRKLQESFEYIEYVIIDEYSMLSQTMLFRIDRRLRQITTKINDMFGGLSIILSGDPGQLLPVAAPCLYDERSTVPINIVGLHLYKSFTKVVQLTELMRQLDDGDEDQQKFIALLPRLRNGDSTLDDFEHLKKRFYRPDKYEEFKDAQRIYCLNDDCSEHNKVRLS